MGLADSDSDNPVYVKDSLAVVTSFNAFIISSSTVITNRWAFYSLGFSRYGDTYH